jgi:hypothetical protein
MSERMSIDEELKGIQEGHGGKRYGTAARGNSAGKSLRMRLWAAPIEDN